MEVIMEQSALAANSGKIGIREKASFVMVNIGNIPVQILLNSFLMIFYTDVVGLNPAAIATLFLLARVVDGINDPIMGFVIDHLPRTKMGRFRSYLFFGAVICCANFLLVWFGPLFAPAGKLAIAYICYLVLGITFDVMDIPLNSMIPCMTDNDKERNALSAIKAAGYMIGSMVLSMAFPLILSRAATSRAGYTALVLIGTGVVLLFTFVGVMGIRERIEPVADEKYKFRDLIQILGCRPVLVLLLATIVSMIGSMIGGGVNMYFYTYILDNRLDVMSLSFLVNTIGTLPFMVIGPMVANKTGKKTIYVAGAVIVMIAPLLRLLSVTNIPLLMVSTVLGGIGFGLTMSLAYGLQADNVDYVEYTTGKRAEGAIASLNSFVVKAAMGIGGAIPGYILAAAGYAANQPQTDAVKTGIIVSVMVLPAVFALAGLLIFAFGYPVGKAKLAEITQTLRDKRAAKKI
jgi:GPH family glycoside/pentoside/hexuronide:cation symporter/glucuronide carrier protein